MSPGPLFVPVRACKKDFSPILQSKLPDFYRKEG